MCLVHRLPVASLDKAGALGQDRAACVLGTEEANVREDPLQGMTMALAPLDARVWKLAQRSQPARVLSGTRGQGWQDPVASVLGWAEVASSDRGHFTPL